MKNPVVPILVAVCAAIALGSCSGKKQIVFYSNADDEAMVSMKKALDAHGFSGQYIEQSYGTSELGGKLMAEGSDIEADLITMSTFYVNSAQKQNHMFRDLTFTTEPLSPQTPYQAPVIALLGSILVNTQMLESNQLPMPASINDLGNPVYKGFVSVVDPLGSSTAWLLLQAVIGAYGEDGAKKVLTGIYLNAGDQLELSGSGPLKKIRAGEVALGFGLRHQAVADSKKGLPITYVDPTEGNYVLTESVAVIDKGKKTNPLAMQMAECIVKYGRPLIIQDYPVALYKGETVAPENQVPSKVFPEPLTVELLKKHQALSESCKQK